MVSIHTAYPTQGQKGSLELIPGNSGHKAGDTPADMLTTEPLVLGVFFFLAITLTSFPKETHQHTVANYVSQAI